MATDYPIEITDPDGSVRIAGLADFTDPDNQPVGPTGPTPPFKPDAGDALPIAELADGTPAMSIDDDDGHVVMNLALDFSGKKGLGLAEPSSASDAANKEYVDGSWQPAYAWVVVQAGAPGADFVSPILVDTTAVSGATYGWDGSAYQKIADLLT